MSKRSRPETFSVGGYLLLVLFVLSMVVGASAASKLGVTNPLLILAFVTGPLLGAIGIAWAAIALRSMKVTVGVDGINVERIGRSTFVSYSQLEGVLRDENRLIVRLRDKRVLSLTLGGPADSIASLDALVQRIDSARAAFATRANAGVEAVLARGERATADWLRELRGLTARAGYREGVVAPDSLWTVIESGAADPATRAAAAIALRRHLDESGQARLRVAADDTASPAARAALEAALRDDDEELVGSLEILSRKTR